ncbi:MAG: NADPH:quinone oxidoreductase family protein [Rhodospirillaceae bacterium]|nr:NADPH:quinone oxidoreductase family protein [Rhodospirillaceae bacterium]
MRAVMCKTLGPPKALVVEECASPMPGAGEVRVAVEAAGVNFPDFLIVQGKYQHKPPLPFSPGSEISGIVDAVGEGVTSLKAGDAVLGVIGVGGFAEKAVARAEHLLKRPATMDPVTAAGFAMTYGTSMHALKQRADLQPGETLLVLGAAGGVGLAAVEIGAAMGARVIAAASSPEKLEIARAAGASDLIDYKKDGLRDRLKEIVGETGVDVVYDPVGGELFEQALRSTAWEGRMLVVGFASGEIPKAPANLPLLKGCSIVGVSLGGFRKRHPEAHAANFDQLFAWHAEGRLKPLVSRTLPMSKAAEALTTLASRGAVGKIVLTMERPA